MALDSDRTLPPPPVSRARFERERRARREAELLLETYSRQLYEANQRLQQQAGVLEEAVRQRTVDLEAARIEADAANEAKSIFLANMSHEIRTPMNGVLGMAAELRETGLTDDQHGILSVIIESGDLLLSVINDVLDLSKIKAGRVELERVPCDLAEIAASAERLFAPKAVAKGLELWVRAPVGQWVDSDPTRLRQIVGNLLSNAIKFTTAGHVLLQVDYRDGPDPARPGEVHLLVEDSGIGMGPAQLSRLFTPYMQADARITRTHGGSGLGLTISRHFCTLMGGDLTAESEPGRGSRFHARIHAPPAARRRPERSQGRLEQDFAIRVRSEGLDILAAEDNQTNQLVLVSMLRRLGLGPRLVGDGLALVAAWRQRRPDVILMDVQMPEMSGIEATMAIREAEAQEGLARTPIIALSANAMTHHLNEYAACGMYASVPKPIRRAALIEAILTVLPNPDPEEGEEDR
ncbi:MAG: ATP-binding protein [Paracoccus sp. (in: a-proteobacteria)]